MRSLVKFAELDLRAAFDFAIMIEEDAQARYEELSRRLGDDPGGAGEVFRSMVAIEGKHRDDLLSRRAALFRDAPPRIEISVAGEGVERPDVDDDDLPRTARQALEVALAAERRAYAFYGEVIPGVKDPDVRAFFERLKEEEAQHAAVLQGRIAALGPSVEVPIASSSRTRCRGSTRPPRRSRWASSWRGWARARSPRRSASRAGPSRES
jgi:rubrerythrin